MKLNLDIAPSRVPDDVSHHKRRFFIELLLTVNVKPVMLQSNRITTEHAFENIWGDIRDKEPVTTMAKTFMDIFKTAENPYLGRGWY